MVFLRDLKGRRQIVLNFGEHARKSLWLLEFCDLCAKTQASIDYYINCMSTDLLAQRFGKQTVFFPIMLVADRLII